MEFNEKKIGTGNIKLSTKDFELIISKLFTDSNQKEDFLNLTKESDLVIYSANVNEDIVNKRRALQIERDFTHELISLILEENFEYGFRTRADQLVQSQMKINSSVTREWLNKIYVANFNRPEIVIGLLRLIARFEINEISPQGKTMAIAALSHKDHEVKECGIRAFESWNSLESIKILQNVNTNIPWLKDYLNRVIESIELEYDIVG
ncbi:hypothetical protein ES705_23274 [subsurface metagenome]